jgi:antitoxin component of MazEF toxin-antitoxin module
MTKTISKVGNCQGIIFDAALMDLARLKVGDQVTVTNGKSSFSTWPRVNLNAIPPRGVCANW